MFRNEVSFVVISVCYRGVALFSPWWSAVRLDISWGRSIPFDPRAPLLQWGIGISKRTFLGRETF